MRVLLVTSLVAGLAGHAYSHYISNAPPSGVKLRKTLGFGPHHPHAVFDTAPLFQAAASLVPRTDMEVAEDFVTGLTGRRSSFGSESMSFKLRKDSYTDKKTGVTHVYAKQVINGLEVVDGDINVNVKDGKVLSFGNSFYKGEAPAPYASLNLDNASSELPHSSYCQHLHTKRQDFYSSNGQVVLGGAAHEQDEDLEHLISSHCTSSPSSHSHHAEADPTDFRHALLKFMLAATPSSSVAEAISEDYPAQLEKLEITPVHHFGSNSLHGEQGPHFEVKNVPDAKGAVKAKMAYQQVAAKDSSRTELELVWKFEVEMEDNWYEASVSTLPPYNILSVVDWASDSPMPMAPVPKPNPSGPDSPASYNIFKWGINDPTEGNRTHEKENFDSEASPVGWHALPVENDPYSRYLKGKEMTAEYGDNWWRTSKDKHGRDRKTVWRNTTTTWGNNVFAQENWEGENNFIGNYRPVATDMNFNFTYDPKKSGRTDMDEAKAYINTTVAQLFYTTNMVHDLYYRYGFDELSGNFQQHNFGRGGEENDAVIANAQDGSGFNNANFMTPPDGQNGRMRMYLWNTATPYRDGDLEAGIVIHELSHGLSTRLTGGPANSGCLGWGESGGMGEGWGDFLATVIRSGSSISSETDYPMGAWAANRAQGIRNFIYSTNETVNPSEYKTLDKPGYWGVHAIGEVWAEMLWVVAKELVGKWGARDGLFPPKEEDVNALAEFYREGPTGLNVPKHGNTLIVQLVLNGMKLQPCRPSFFEARDAIIQADNVLTGGENFCELWRGFAKRGLGQNARVDGRTPWGGGIRTNGYKVPGACEEY